MIPKLAEKSECTGCGACSASCGHNALSMQIDKNGYLRPRVDEKSCVGCGLCEMRCPVLHLDKLPFHNPNDVRNYAAWSTDDALCRKASSGGIFSQLAINILREGNGAVFGATWTEDSQCYHIGIDKVEELDKIIGTKYIQSDASNSYPQVRKALKENKCVLFCGTPCQIAGLHAYLGYKDYEQLYTAELICHGVGSRYAMDIALEYFNAAQMLSFRDKEEGWVKGNLNRVSQKNTYLLKDGSKVKDDKHVYWKMFCQTHRDSCTHCRFAQISRCADVSLGDLWGMYGKYPQRWQLGASLVLANTAKGQAMIGGEDIASEQLPNSTLTCYQLFYPGATSLGQYSHSMWLVNKLPVKLAVSFLTLDKRNPLAWPMKLINKYACKQHLKNTQHAIKNAKQQLGWL